ncbi:histidinol dehydrogenase [Jiulongibacter sp. NS-SX5]|uniref:histidinol dehydrogenase n=1 Tax=Jiulongibacter sp. NS-SX5 TaxID=3463854 RepID=UPI004057D1CA
MQEFFNPERKDWKKILARPTADMAEIEQRVIPIIDAVRHQGDEAIRKFALDFDNILLNDFEVKKEELQKAGEKLDEELKSSIDQAIDNITKFHSGQLSEPDVIETMPGVECWRKSVGIEKVGIYVPGGTAPLFSSVLMLAIPAKLAGSKEIILCSPSNHPAIYYCALKCGVSRVFRIGGAQAVAALAYGTETVPQVYKIFGPGNQYVTAAKQLVSKEGVAIDMPAGPSEVAVLADESSNPAFVAADLLSQAEHGIDSQVVLVTTDQDGIETIKTEISNQLAELPRKELASKSLENSKIIYFNNQEEAIELLNEYAAEHLILSVDNPDEVGEKIINAGSIFLGHYTPESCGDYASGTNHTLPTNGFAKAYSGVSVDSFVKKITYQRISKDGLQKLGPVVSKMAEEEQLQGHSNAVKVRLK